MTLRTLLGTSFASFLAFASLSALNAQTASAQMIKQPGRHPHYGVELEPHLALHWDRDWVGHGTGVGPGFRATIPIIQDGPISKINNSMGIGFGFDWVFWGNCDYEPYYDSNCRANQLWIPVVMQWNFFFTPVISVFGEVGFAMVNRHHSWGDGACPIDRRYGCTTNDFDPFQPIFWGGGRFLFSDTVGFVARIGTPSLTLGVDFLL